MRGDDDPVTPAAAVCLGLCVLLGMILGSVLGYFIGLEAHRCLHG